MKKQFTLTFGKQPSSYINREYISGKKCNDFCLDFPLSQIYIISEVRSSCKTVLLTNVSKTIKNKKEEVTETKIL